MVSLIIVESPSKCATIKKYLGPDYVIKASYGHVMDLPNDGPLGVNLDKDFELQYKVLADKIDKLESLKAAARNADMVYLASDADREGEIIAWNLFQEIYPINNKIKRVNFKEITKTEVIKQLKNLRDLDDNLIHAAQARRAIDRIVGFLVSGFLRDKIDGLTSAGRVQSPAIKMVVDREREIESFIPEEYWNLSAFLENQDGKIIAKFQPKNKIRSQEEASKVKNDLLGSKFTISKVDEVEKKKPPLPPLTTSSLTALGAGRLKMPAKRTMEAAQKLYETGLITYMRTDSLRVSPEALQSCREYLAERQHGLPTSPNLYSSKAGAQDAHEAIRPTDIRKLPKNIIVSDDEYKVYKLIWERFVASQLLPAKYDTVQAWIETDSSPTKLSLKIQGKVLKEKGWLEITGAGDEDSEEENKLPPLKVGQELFLINPKIKSEQKFTQPPPRFSGETLIKELEKRNIGRPSTIATIMTKITERNYVVLEKNMVYRATEMGKKIVAELEKHFDFIQYQYTSNLEEKLDLIAEGKLNYLQLMREFYNPFSKQLKAAYISFKRDFGFQCPFCKELMILRRSQTGNYLACINFPHHCHHTLNCEVVDEKPVIREKSFQILKPAEGKNCPLCQGPVRDAVGKYGPYYKCFEETCRGTLPKLSEKRCPKCHSGLAYRIYLGESVLKCVNRHSCEYKEPAGKILAGSTTSKIAPEKVRKFFKQR